MRTKMILETKRLILRELTIGDSAFVFEIVNTKGWLQNIGDKNVKSEEEAINYLSGPFESYKINKYGMWLIEEKTSSVPIGLCGLINRPSLEDIDIGFALLPKFTKKGYALEAASATMDYAKNVLKIDKVVGICNTDNQNSIRLLEKLGLRIEKTIRFENEKEVYLMSPS